VLYVVRCALCVEGREDEPWQQQSGWASIMHASSEVQGACWSSPPSRGRRPQPRPVVTHGNCPSVCVRACYVWVGAVVGAALWLACERKTTKQRRRGSGRTHSFSSGSPTETRDGCMERRVETRDPQGGKCAV